MELTGAITLKYFWEDHCVIIQPNIGDRVAVVGSIGVNAKRKPSPKTFFTLLHSTQHLSGSAICR